MRAKAALFDKDGTILSFQKTWGPWAASCIEILAAGDAGVAKKMTKAWDFDPVHQVFGENSIVVSGTVAEGAGAILPYLAGFDLSELIGFLDDTGARAQPVEEVPMVSFLDRFAQLGVAVGIGTNDSERTARAQLGAIGIDHRFGFIAGYDSGHGGKPGPGMCLAFAAHLGLEPRDIVMVGDSSHDVEAGRRAGMQTVGVLSGVAVARELAPFSDVILPDIGHLPDWLAHA